MTRMIGAVSPSGRRNLRNGRVIDPESKLDAVRNVGIRGGKIVTISEQQTNGGTLIDFMAIMMTTGLAQTLAGDDWL